MPDLRPMDVGRVERLVALRSVPDLRSLTRAELAVLAAIARPRTAASGAVLAREGHPTSAFFVVVEGELAVQRRGRELRVAPHEIACAIEALSGDAAGCGCTALTAATVLEIPVDDLEDAAEEQPAILVRLVRRVARQALELRRASPTARAARSTTAAAAGIDLVDRMLFLRRTGALGARTIDGVAALAAIARELRVPAGTALWRAGDRSESILAILAGTVVETAPGGARCELGAGELAGELDALAGEPRFADAVAGEGLTALAFDRDTLFDAWEDHLDLGIDVLRALARDVLAALDA